MDKKIIKSLIDEKMEVIQEQFSIIKAYEGKIPAIELDLVMSSIRDLYELILSLQVENISSALPGQPEKHELPIAVPPAPPVALEEPEEFVPELSEETPEKPAEETKPVVEPFSASRFSPGIISMEPVTEESAAPELPQPVYRAPEPEPVSPPVPAPAPPPLDVQQPEKPQRITFDLFTEATASTLADRLREGQDKSLADKLKENKVVDLRTTIGINDKFLFINELFDGNMRVYDEIIQKLNAAVTMAQADLLMLDLKIAYNWDSESPTVKKFVELIRRKF